jgi:S-adenosylmethionine:diacylglycerol 3-amino-3-carboxypropyl transferase
MKFLFDFGLSQEDPRTEQKILDPRQGDQILSVASGGEVPLGLSGLNENIRITAVDISLPQIMLCKLKLITALHVDFPHNARFLGYTGLSKVKRLEIFNSYIRPNLSRVEETFWDEHLAYIMDGVINAGRFEQYIRKMRMVAGMVLGRKNLESLIQCKSLAEQNDLFNKKIAPRNILKILFKIAFHPKIYKNRGLHEQALIHAGEDTGQRFFRWFRDFCSNTDASENYFLQYFLRGTCSTENSFPDYLQPSNRSRLEGNKNNIEFRHVSFEEAIQESKKPGYNKIHLSNLGDWMDAVEFNKTMDLIKHACGSGTRICYRFLQKDHMAGGGFGGYKVDREAISGIDRFPFYSAYLIVLQ